jgi:hypothetical protein
VELDDFLKSLIFMAYGMGGILVFMSLFYLLIKAINRIFPVIKR